MPYPTSIRLPEDVRRVLRKEAKRNRRTVTEQINFVLQEWIKQDAGLLKLLDRKVAAPSKGLANDAG